MRKDQVLNCSFQKWYALFKHLTFKSEIIPIPDTVVQYLKSDSTIILPKSCQEELDLEAKNNKDEYDVDSVDWSEEDQPVEYPDFPEFDAQIRKALEKFNHKVFIKLNWSSPKDAYWTLNKLSCNRLSDVYMLLRSSDFITHDLNEPFSECSDLANESSEPCFTYYLVVREWININPSVEFRCFVHMNQLIAISPRDCRTFYKMLLDSKSELQTRIEAFYINNIYKKFFDESFVFDVCLGKKTVKLLDFNPFGKVTDSLLFSWDELTDQSLKSDPSDAVSKKLEFRLIESELGIHSGQYSVYSQPRDTIDTCLDTDYITSMIDKNIKLQDKEIDD